MLATKKLKIGDDRFVVSEVSVGVILPILPKLQGTPEEQQDAQLEMMKQCIEMNDEPLGDRILEIGLKAYLKLAEEVMKINGLQEHDGEEGKD